MRHHFQGSTDSFRSDGYYVHVRYDFNNSTQHIYSFLSITYYLSATTYEDGAKVRKSGISYLLEM